MQPASVRCHQANPVLSAASLGDWREKVIYRSEDNYQLSVFTFTIPLRTV